MKKKSRLHILYEKQNGICALCKSLMKKRHASLDHILPKSKGGGRGNGNLQAVHKICNQIKGSESRQRPATYYFDKRTEIELKTKKVRKTKVAVVKHDSTGREFIDLLN